MCASVVFQGCRNLTMGEPKQRRTERPRCAPKGRPGPTGGRRNPGQAWPCNSPQPMQAADVEPNCEATLRARRKDRPSPSRRRWDLWRSPTTQTSASGGRVAKRTRQKNKPSQRGATKPNTRAPKHCGAEMGDCAVKHLKSDNGRRQRADPNGGDEQPKPALHFTNQQCRSAPPALRTEARAASARRGDAEQLCRAAQKTGSGKQGHQRP